MEAPESIRIGLANIRPTLHLRWNRQARVVGEASFDVNGNPRKVEFDPRWEIWDTDESGREYRVTTLEGPKGEFVPPGEWVLELMALINPANYGGDLHKMVEALVDKPNARVEKLAEDRYRELVDYFADLFWSAASSGSRITVPQVVN